MKMKCMKSTEYGISCLSRGTLFLFLLTVFVLQSVTLLAQNDRTIRGTVIDENEEPVIGATVVAIGTNRSTITNLDGAFELNLPSTVKTLEISFLGYNKAKVQLKAQSTYKVQLTESLVQLDEVVAIGYGSAKRGNLTGSVSKVDASKIENRPAPNIASALQGMLSGVEIRSTSGAPGEELEIRVRGAASINADAVPLYVLDGIPVDNLGSINPNDIESIEVLKDASSSAIYGSRGANGVILITTKTASKSDKVRVDFSASYGIQQLERRVDVLSPEEWIDFRTAYNNYRYVEKYAAKGATANDDWETRLAMNGGKISYYYMNDPRWSQPNYGGLALIDWQDEFFRLAPIQNYQLSVSNGNKNSKYRLSLGYIDQQGVAIETSYKRLNLRANVESRLFDRITMGFNIAPTMTWNEGGSIEGKDQQAQKVLSMCPIAEPEAGVYEGAEPYDSYLWASSNVSPIAFIEQNVNHRENINVNSSAYLKIDLLKGLKLEATGSYIFSSQHRRIFTPSSVLKKWEVGEGYHTSANRSDTRSHKYLFQTILNYNRTFRKHTVGLMAGYSMESSSGASSSLSAKQFADNSLEVFTLNDQAITGASATLTTPSRLLSYFGRFQYEYDNRYLLTASIRRDGSSRFGRENRWGTFPAVSAAYRVSNEKFWPKDFVMNQLKVRASWGLNGNNSISNGAALGLMESANYSLGSLVNGFAPSSIDNEKLGWEKTHSWNIGIDLGFFNNRIVLAADYYDKTTKDLLYKVSVPAIMGFTKAWGNIGSIGNRGFELELTTQNLTGKLNWSTSLNVSYNKNEVKSLGEDNTTVFIGYSDSNTQVFMVGQPLRAYYMYDAVGVYQTKEDLKKYPTMTNSQVGDVRYRDANDDGVINDQDRTLVGKPSPDYTFGFTNSFRYKDFDLSILLTAQTGGKLYSVLGRAMDRPGMGASINVLAKWKNMWRSEEEPGDGKTPGIDNKNTSSLYDSRWLYSTDFIKIKNITLGYRIPVKRFKYLSSARLYMSAENVWMWDKFDGGFSPESNNGGKTADYDYGAYPQPRTITLGVNVTF